MATTSETFQIPEAVAEVYESKFVPRLFAPWARHLVDAAGGRVGQCVLDVACGTGVVAREVAARQGGHGRVVGLDLNESMLAVARRLRPEVEWRQGDAAHLPFDAASFDLVLCQSALMFFPDPVRALSEMARVVTPTGRVAIQVWASLETQPAYGPFVEVAARHAGPEAISLLGTYWSLGDLERLHGLFDAAGLEIRSLSTRVETARFDSIDELVRTEVESTPLGERITAEVYERILEDARVALDSFRAENGTAEIPLAGHLIVAAPR